MAQYKTDLEDIFFNLFDVLGVDQRSKDFARDDLQEIINQFEKFVENEVYPTRTEGDEVGVKMTDKGVVAPESFKKALSAYHENGWFSLGYPEEIGGMPCPESVSFACKSIYVGANCAFSMYSGLTQGALNVIHLVGDEKQKATYLPPIMEGRWGGTMCLTEAGAGSDVGASKTTATPKDDGSYSIKGVKIFISSGESDLYENNIHMVLARTPNSPEGTKGLSLFIVPRFRVNDDGSLGETNHVVCTKIEEKMGIHGSATCEMTFGGEGECQGFLIGKEFEGMANMFIMMNEARLLCAIQGEAQANLAYELTTQYAKERVQFGQEIEKLPDVKRMLLKMRAMSRGMRSLVLYTADLFDKEKAGDEAASDLIALLTPVCKSYCTDEGFQVAVDAVQVHGGYGYCSEYGIEQFVRDIKIATIYEGTNGIQAIDFVTRKILKDGGKTLKALVSQIKETVKEASSQSIYKKEVAQISDALVKANEILSFYTEKAQSQKFNDILTSATDFLNLCGNIIISWRLMKSALVAGLELQNAQGDRKEYLKSKEVDLKVFCQYFLTRNLSISESILSYDQDLSHC